MAGMETLLARIKALFKPSGQAEPSPEVDAPPAQVAAIPEVPEVPEVPDARAAAPVAVAMEAPPTEEVPAVPEAPVVVEGPVVAEEAPPDVEPAAAAPSLPPGVLALRLENERESRSTFEVTRSGATIGRGPESTIQLADLSVSRKHARIAYRQGAYWLSDLGSMGGTWVDGTKLAAPRRISTGQTIDIGVCRLTVVSTGADEERATAKSASHAASRR